MKRKVKWLPLWLAKLLILGLIAAFFGGGLILFWIATLEIPDFSSFETRVVTESTKIYDRTGKVLLYDVHGQVRRQVVPFDQISINLKNATIAIEDAEFYQHHGIKPTAIIRAFFANLLSGELSQGGSTITQQAIKNSVLTKEKSISRKIKEAILSLKLERALSKNEILALYLNEAPYGGTMYGVEEAAQSFFGKPASEVSLPEAAYIAGLAQRPTYFSPYGKNVDRLEERKNLVLRRMRELEFITPTEEEIAKNTKVSFQPQNTGGIKAPHFVLWVRDYLAEKYGEDEIETRGLKVITSLDWDLQQKAEAIVREYGETNVKNFNANNAALVAIDPKTGQVLAMVGSRDYFDTENDGNFNIALAHRQPGSSFKPFVYATAFTKGFTPETAIFDLPTQFDTACASNPDRCYAPSNYDDQFRGPMTFRTALAQSINIPAIKVLYLAGVKDVLALARNLGIESLNDPARYCLTLVLGGGEVSLLDMTGAYSVFANEGTRNPTVSILRVEDTNSRVLEEFTASPRQVLEPKIARQISNILSDNQARQPTYAANSALYFPNHDVAAKTGTTNDYRDAWIMGYTPTLAVGAWAGNNDNTPMEKKVAGMIVAPMWHAFMEEAIAAMPEERFTPPEPPSPELAPVYRGFWQGNQNYFIDKSSGKLATEYTPEELREEHVVQQVHSILYWLGRTNDSQFELWEKPIRDWARKNGHADQSENVIPTESDNIHTAANRPRFNIISPQTGASYTRDERIAVEVGGYQGKYPLSQVEVFLNDQLVDSVKRAPFTIAFIPRSINEVALNNTNSLRVVVYDEKRNKSEQTIEIEIKRNNN